MSEISVSLPDSVSEFVQQQVAQGSYPSASEYIAHLVRQDERRIARERLEALLLEGLDSGEPVEVTDEWWERKTGEWLERLDKEVGK